MQNDIEQIKRLCYDYRVKPKLLLIPSASIRMQLLKALGDHGVFPLNLSVRTIKELAYEIAENSIRAAGLTVLDSRGVTDAMTDILGSLRERGELQFFDAIEITPGICKVLSKTVTELLGCGYRHGIVGLNLVDNERKRVDLRLIIESYFAWKNESKYADYSDVIELARGTLKERRNGFACCYALEACEFDYLESRLLDEMGLQADSAGRETGESICVPGGPATPEVSGSHPLELRAKETGFFEAYGEYNEVKEVLRRIILDKIPFDNVLIVTTVSEPYSQLLCQLVSQYAFSNDSPSGRRELPVTFGTGLPLLMSSPAKLLMLLLDWIGSGFSSKELINVFSGGVFDVRVDQRGEDGVMPMRADRFSRLNVVNVIKNSGLTWQQRSYLPCLEKYSAHLRRSAEENVNAIKAAGWLIEFVTAAFQSLPPEDDNGLVDVEDLLSALKAIVRKYKRVFSAFDVQGLSAVLYELNSTIRGRRARLHEAIEIIKEHMRDIRILRQSPEPGKIHLATYKQAAWIERNNVFFVGLGSDHFPGLAIEDPLLLDHERMEPMATSSMRIGKNIEIIAALLESFSGGLTCSYSSFDTVENRERYPAALFHELHSLAPGELVDYAGFVVDRPELFIDGNDFWLYKGVNGGAVLSGDEAQSRKASSAATAPMWSSAEQISGKVLSASSLSDFLSCKHKFFLKNILQLKEVKSRDFDTLGWLTDLETGSVYHAIFEKFLYHSMDNPGILADASLAIKGINIIAETEIARCEDELPTASSFHTGRQRNEVLENVSRFAVNEVEKSSARSVEKVEMAFGFDEPLTIRLGEGRRVNAYGYIDRIDVTVDGDVEITDYKTGSKWLYEGMQDPGIAGLTEANAQLALYYLALRELAATSDDPDLAKLRDITKMSYHFVTAKGDYDTISLHVDDDSEDVYKAALSELVDEIGKGLFPPEKGAVRLSDDRRSPNCRYCGYARICVRLTEVEED